MSIIQEASWVKDCSQLIILSLTNISPVCVLPYQRHLQAKVNTDKTLTIWTRLQPVKWPFRCCVGCFDTVFVFYIYLSKDSSDKNSLLSLLHCYTSASLMWPRPHYWKRILAQVWPTVCTNSLSCGQRTFWSKLSQNDDLASLPLSYAREQWRAKRSCEEAQRKWPSRLATCPLDFTLAAKRACAIKWACLQAV